MKLLLTRECLLIYSIYVTNQKIGETEDGYPIVKVVTSTNKDAGSGWIPYMIKATNDCTFSHIWYGNNVGGLGNVKGLTTTGTHKMAEVIFQSFNFIEVLAIDGAGDWMTLERDNLAPFTAQIAFD